MNHLTFEEIAQYVSLKKLDEEAFALASKVDTHIRECDQCLELVRAVRTIHDELVKRKRGNDLLTFFDNPPVLDAKTQKRIEQIQSAFRSMEK